MELVWIWAIILACSLLVEFFTMQMFAIWVAFGALCGLVMSLIGGIALEVQILSACGVALLSMLFLRKLAMKYLHKSADKNSAEPLLNKTCVVVEEISADKAGAVKVNGVVWTAISEETLAEGQKVKIVELIGNKLKVKGEL